MSGELADLLRGESRAKQRRLLVAVTDAVDKSFSDGFVIIHKTRAEENRRAEICIEGIRMMRADLKWTVDRVSDCIHAYLKARLSGVQWEPPQRSAWAPESKTEHKKVIT